MTDKDSMKGLKQKLQEIDLKVHELSEKVRYLKNLGELDIDDLDIIEDISDNLAMMSKKSLLSWKNWHETEHLDITSMGDFTKQVSRTISALEELLDLEITFENSSDYEGHLYMDPENLGAVFTKVIKNAKCSKANRATVKITDFSDAVRLIISDNGEGIEQSKLDELNSESKRNEGQGQFIKNRVSKMGAQVKWNSIEGFGSSAILTFQACGMDEVNKISEQKKINELNKNLEDNARLGGSQIMIVDDSRVTLKLFEDLFLKEGAKVKLFAKPEEALDELSDVKPDCLLVDYEMPGMNGEELIREVRSLKEYSDLPILILTSREDDDTIVRCLNAGANDYIFKITNVNVIISKVESTLKQNRIQKELLSLQKVAGMKSIIVTLNHEFNNIITILLGRLSRFKKLLNDSDKDQVEPLEKSLLRLVKLIKKIGEIEKYGHIDYGDGNAMIDLNEDEKKAG